MYKYLNKEAGGCTEVGPLQFDESSDLRDDV